MTKAVANLIGDDVKALQERLSLLKLGQTLQEQQEKMQHQQQAQEKEVRLGGGGGGGRALDRPGCPSSFLLTTSHGLFPLARQPEETEEERQVRSPGRGATHDTVGWPSPGRWRQRH